MSRKEDFIQAGIKYRFEQGKPMAIGGGNFAEMASEMNRNKPFEAGAEYGYQYAIKKTIEFLKEKEFGDWIEQEATSFVEDFRTAMEE
jgi:hypothetical protein